MNNKKIAVIDDDESLNNKITKMLSTLGFSVVSAYNGQEGLELIRQERPSLIILDINMPIMDGLAMLRLLRKDEGIKNTKVIVLTNVASSRIAMYAAELGVVDYLIKANYTYNDIIERVKKYF